MRRVPIPVLFVLAATLSVVRPPDVYARDGVAVIIEIRPNAGQVQVKRADEAAWRPAEPLLTLRPGDQVNVVRDARVTLAFIGSRGTRVLGASDSPFAVSDVSKSPSHRAWEAVGKVVEFLIGVRRESAFIPVSVRQGPSMQVAILSPRDTWHWQLETPNVSTQQAYFEILNPDQADQVRAVLDQLGSPEVSDGSHTSVAILKSSFLFQQGLYCAARKELTSGVVKDPAEPTLHFVLGLLYEHVGLMEMAGQEFLQARDLTDPR